MSRIGKIGGNANGCAACGHQFAALSRFDAHQVIDYARPAAVSCRHPSSLGLVEDGNGVWQTPEGLATRQRAALNLRHAAKAARPG